MKILEECKRFLSYGGLGTEQFVNIGKERLPRWIIRAMLTFTHVLMNWMQAIILVNNYKLGLHAILLSIHCLLNYVVKCAVYWALVWKVNKIVDLFYYIEIVVQRRMFFFFSRR